MYWWCHQTIKEGSQDWDHDVRSPWLALILIHTIRWSHCGHPWSFPLCRCGKTSPTTMAMYKQFGNTFQHEPWTASTTLAQLVCIESTIDPWDLDSYLPQAKQFQLNDVHHLFWRDWPLVEPSLFLTPEQLHHWHKMFWDHNVKWCIWTVGVVKIDFQFSVLQPHVSFVISHSNSLAWNRLLDRNIMIYNATLWGLLQALFLGIFSLQCRQLWISGIFSRQKNLMMNTA